MPNQSIGLSNYDPETARIQRQQQLAQLLQEQSQQDIPINSSGGIQAPISPLSIIAKALQAYQGKRLSDKADQQYADLQTKRQQGLADMLSKQYQVPGKAAQGVTLPEIAPVQGDIPIQGGGSVPISWGGQAADPTQGAISNATPARPTTPQEQLANSLSMMSSGNPTAAQMGAPLYEQALKQQQSAPYYQSIIAAAPAAVQPMLAHALASGDTKMLDTYGATLAGKSTPQAVNQATEITPQQAGISPSALPPGAKLFRKPDNTIEVVKTSDMSSQGRMGQEIGLAQTKANFAAGAGVNADPTVVANWAKNIHTGLATIRQVPPAIRGAVSDFLAGESDAKDSPEVAAKFTRASSLITSPYTKMSQYQLTADAAPYIQRMAAAAKHPGSIGDADLLDSLIKLNTGGNAITEAQASLVTGGRSLSDTINVMKNKLSTGGVLSEDQRKQILSMGKEIAGNYQKGFKPVYDKAVAQLKSANIPERYWTIPDINSIQDLAGFNGGGKTVVRTGKDAQGNKVVQYSDGTIEHAP